ncbi:DUF1156 domain-containing protein [Streptomyces antibioticus]|uniref:DUF1156 domain-containing protein n=1 Tax=Streptomyces antibioticus TaxID=1890 RepID=UPI00368A5761
MSSIKPRVLIEDWLPVAELGIESRRESAPIPGQFPKLKALHVWWARRPLVASAAVVLAGLLPAWNPRLGDAFPGNPELSSPAAYRRWVLKLVGIWGDPIAARRRITAATERGETLGAVAYGYRPAFKNVPDAPNVALLHEVLRHTWGGSLPLVADPTAGGGSIPFASARLGLPTAANDLNAVAAAVLKAGVEIPVCFGHDLTPELKEYGHRWRRRVEERLGKFFVYEEGEKYLTYIWANAVRCPRTGGLVPLITDQWLDKAKGRETAVRIVVHDQDGNLLSKPIFEIARGDEIDFDPSIGLMTGGTARSPYDNLAIDDAYIKAEAQSGRFEQVLYAVYYRKTDRTKGYRAPSSKDATCLEHASDYLVDHRADWEATGCLPTEEITEISNYNRGHRMYGITKWTEMFTERQLVVHAVFAEELQRLLAEAEAELGQEKARALLTVLGMIQAKALNYNARLGTWDIGRQKTRSVFEKHNFTFRWTFVEFQGSKELPLFVLDQVFDAYDQLVTLVGHMSPDSLVESQVQTPVMVTQGTAANLGALASGAVSHLCMDPPYYDNVMYAELSDFFYVWEKATLGRLYPDFFAGMETDKDNEAIANVARFIAFGRRKQQLADADYTAKMTAIFSECSRVLREDGVMTVMFTHKKAEAWDALGTAIIDAGFSIETSWPVNTEPATSSHQKNKNAANSTIMLTCRKREQSESSEPTYLEDVETEIRSAARDAVLRFQNDGIGGVDLLLSTYGPALSVISRHWPVYSSTPDEDGRDQLLRPEDALSLAREEIVGLRRTRLIGQGAKSDMLTDFVLLAWDTFAAREFPYDTARLLALAVGGLDVERLERAKILKKGPGTVKLLTPRERVRRGAESDLPGVRPEAKFFANVIDAVDTALYIAEYDNWAATKRFLDKHGYTNDVGFNAVLQGLVNAIPRTKVKGSWAVPEAGLLDTMCTLYFPDVSLLEATSLAKQHDDKPNQLFEME